MDLNKKYQQLRDIILNIDPDIHKANEGNKAAGRRARKGLQTAKVMCQELRKLVTDAVASE